MSDVGVDLAMEVTEELRKEAKLVNAKSTDDLRQLIIEKLLISLTVKNYRQNWISNRMD